jgi:predicted dehydrogenase
MFNDRDYANNPSNIAKNNGSLWQYFHDVSNGQFSLTHAVAEYAAHQSISEALDAFGPGYVVISNRTSEHYDALTELIGCGYSGKVLIEKPVFRQLESPVDTQNLQAAVGYNLRFDPVITELRKLLVGKRLLMVSISAGQHLDEWRPGTDYRKSYSASVREGGGVLRDLSHELDYCQWLFGKWSRVTALGGNYGSLDIEADELWSITAEATSETICNIQLSYLDRPARREISINTDSCTIHADLVRSTIKIDGAQVFESEHSRDQTYLDMHKAMLRGDMSSLCSIDEGVSILQIIENIETAAKERLWASLC